MGILLYYGWICCQQLMNNDESARHDYIYENERTTIHLFVNKLKVMGIQDTRRSVHNYQMS